MKLIRVKAKDEIQLKSDVVKVELSEKHIRSLADRLIEKLKESEGLITVFLKNIENHDATEAAFIKGAQAAHDQLTTTRKSIQKSIKYLA